LLANRTVSLPRDWGLRHMSNELLGEWLTYASFAVPGMFCFVGAVWVEWRDKASPYRMTDDTIELCFQNCVKGKNG
jgi:hypothetical protein